MAAEVKLRHSCCCVIGVTSELHLQDVPDQGHMFLRVKNVGLPDQGSLQSDKILLGQAAWGRCGEKLRGVVMWHLIPSYL